VNSAQVTLGRLHEEIVGVPRITDHRGYLRLLTHLYEYSGPFRSIDAHELAVLIRIIQFEEEVGIRQGTAARWRERRFEVAADTSEVEVGGDTATGFRSKMAAESKGQHQEQGRARCRHGVSVEFPKSRHI